MKDLVLFITGAAKGIGFDIAQAFAKEGIKVMISDLDDEALEKAKIKIEGVVETCVCDVSDEKDIELAIQKTIDTFGKIDILINNAGIQHVEKIEDFPSDMFQKMMKIMLVAPFLTMKHVLPVMKKNQFGRIINISSINGVVGFEGKAAYNTAKHGVIGLTKVAALENATSGITVNALCPGYIDTGMVENQYKEIAELKGISVEEAKELLFSLIPQNRLLDVSEISSLALYLISDQAKGMTGQAVIIDGGYTAQ